MTLGDFAILTLKAWHSSPALQERHQGDLTDFHQRALRQALDCDEDEIPPLIAEALREGAEIS